MIFFTNFTSFDFQHTWNSQEFVVKSGQTIPIAFSANEQENLNIAKTLGRHLLQKWSQQTGGSLINEDDWNEGIAKIITSGEFNITPKIQETEEKEKLEKKQNQNIDEVKNIKKKTTKKVTKKTTKKTEDDTFEGLNS